MRKKLESYLINLIKSGPRSICDKIVLFILSILEKIYNLLILLRRLLYNLNLVKPGEVEARVISVGNITAGGTGKTPLVIYLAKKLAEENRVVVISRGYQSQSEGEEPSVVSDGRNILTDVSEAGDEVYMMATLLGGVPLITGSNRYKAARLASRRFNAEIIILDDGFQHWQLKRDVDIVMIDGLKPFGQGRLIPRGFLREPLSGLKRADFFVISRAHHISREKLQEIKDTLCQYNQNAVVYEATTSSVYLKELSVASLEMKSIIHKKRPLDELKGAKVIAVCGLGNPRSFYRDLEISGAEVIETLSFNDHHQYRPDDFDKIINLARQKAIDIVITTEKDAVKFSRDDIKKFIDHNINLYVLGIEISLKGTVDLAQVINKY
ncbi:tetraacyldisaccharide 4'-kinase [Halothermothrix orenii]|nr:tetraacyldisaccharide 4'-kinase [Halothermothrix orenii]